MVKMCLHKIYINLDGKYIKIIFQFKEFYGMIGNNHWKLGVVNYTFLDIKSINLFSTHLAFIC